MKNIALTQPAAVRHTATLCFTYNVYRIDSRVQIAYYFPAFSAVVTGTRSMISLCQMLDEREVL